MRIPLFQIDAFTDQVLKGNPAAVCLLDAWLDDALLQAIAAENNLSETAFLVGGEGRYALRWFTPTTEIDLCGHATLASGFVIFEELEPLAETLHFDTRSGVLRVERRGDLIEMDFPAFAAVPCPCPKALVQGLGLEPSETLRSAQLVAVFEHEEAIRSLRPDFARLAALDDTGIVVATAPGLDTDFVSRVFAPRLGIPEDPVTGSAHCVLAPYWAERLGRPRLHARQLSLRGGDVFCEWRGDRVGLSGRAVRYLAGEIFV
jgi:PhzF family phenazine biosynthesis protein